MRQTPRTQPVRPDHYRIAAGYWPRRWPWPAAIRALLEMPEVARVTYLRLEVVGPRMVFVTGDVDLTGDDTESHVAVRLRALEAKFCASPAVARAVLSLSAPDEPSLEA